MKHNLSDDELRKLLKNELMQAGRFQREILSAKVTCPDSFINPLATVLLYTFTF